MRKLWKSSFSFISTSYKIALKTAREGGTHARASRYGKAMRNQRKPMATTDAVKDKTCVDQIGFGWSLVCAGLGLAGPRPSKPRASMKTFHVMFLTIGLWSPKPLLVWKNYEKAMGKPQTTLEREISPIWKSWDHILGLLYLSAWTWPAQVQTTSLHPGGCWYEKTMGKLWESNEKL